VPLKQENFRGLYARGMADQTPDAFFIDCLNTRYPGSGVQTRNGSILNLTTPGRVKRFYVYKRLNETPRFIYLDVNGSLWDSLYPGAPIWTDATILDFSLVNYNNRAYITPHNRLTGITSKSVLVYEGSGTARIAAGNGPTGFTLVAANSADSGNVEAGYHFFAVAFVTASGFITVPGPLVFPSLNCTGGKKVSITSIPTGGSAIVSRVLLATKAIPTSTFVENQSAYELFFIPNSAGGVISDNTTTSRDVSFFDNQLLDSADYLLDNLSTIPAGVGIGIYGGRLIVWGESGNEFTIRCSSPLQPEVFNSINGFISLDPSDADSGIKNCFEHRKSLIIATSNRFYATADNGSDPNTWAVEIVDKSVGTECFGVATVLDSRGTNTDRVFVATKPGLVSFEGFAKRPELTWNIEDVWRRINKAEFSRTQVIDDPVGHKIYVNVCLDSATMPNYLLYGDYVEAFTPYGTLDEKAIKWSVWNFCNTGGLGASCVEAITGDLKTSTKVPVLFYALNIGNIYEHREDESLLDDFGAAIDSYFQTALKTSQNGWINHVAGIKLRVVGSGALQITLYGEDNVTPTTANSITLSLTPGKDFDRLVNFINEKCSFKFRVSNYQERFHFKTLTVYMKPLWLRRPG
jgi:hypothetical protein